ncbi:MAG: DsrE/DsrF/TusD sulfur relay family protein [Candidatus Thorarchaeota archaeon]
MEFLLILNDPAYGTERSYNGLRLAMALLKENPDDTVRVFLIGDAVTCAISGQKTPDGYYNLERMIRALVGKKMEIKCCGTCMDARGLDESSLVTGVKRSSMSDLAKWTSASDKIITF